MSARCFDTHALFFWATSNEFSEKTLALLDYEVACQSLWASAICFWELALQARKGRIVIPDIVTWKREVCDNSGLLVLAPSADNMISSTLLPDLHKDPFDRLLIAQAQHRDAAIVTRDRLIAQYDIRTEWPA